METFAVAPLLGAELMEIMGLDGLSIQNPENYNKYLEVAKYFSRFEDATNVARMVSRNTPLKDRLDKMLEYTRLRRSLDETRAKKAELPSADLATNDTPEMAELRTQLDTQENFILNELAYYER